ncbi:ATP-dependent zinc protease [Candidatus Saccharibacteria bacterium]|nr:ATP-dependent zinc protease [Candidatus Saccharibacteria bacterium]
MNNEVFGSFEVVSIPALGIDETIAKIDTGAYSGALHCSFMKSVKRDSDGKRVLRFIPSDNRAHMTEIENYTHTYIRSSTGHRVKRFLFTTDIIIRGKTYPIKIGLSDRSDMQREVLIGRRFLRENGILVDVRINQELDNDGGEKL